MAHFGFIVEAILEAFPQCILQMVCIIWYQEASPLAMYSILLSVTTIASKGVVFSFSIDPIVFVFNVCCVLIDIFGFFATLTWICYLPAQHSFITWLFWLQFRLMVTFIMLVVVLIVATLIVGPLLVSLYHAVDDIGRRTHSWSHFFSTTPCPNQSFCTITPPTNPLFLHGQPSHRHHWFPLCDFHLPHGRDLCAMFGHYAPASFQFDVHLIVVHH
jgi:hypothetical protein